MKIRKFLSIIVCLTVFLPSFASAVSAKDIARLCLDSGIAQYYASLSDATFKMVNVMFQDFLDNAKQASKKESPAKQEQQPSKSDKAILPDNGSYKNLKTNLVLSPVSFDSVKDVYSAKITGDGSFMSFGWMILLIITLLLCVRKKDDYVASIYHCVNKHPVYV